jgi:uncharacterized protein (TIGR03492 family)
MFLELHPLIRPLKWIVYRSGLFTPPIRGVLRAVESRLGAGTTGWRRRIWLLIASDCYNHLMWDAYYEGVWRALSQRSEIRDRRSEIGDQKAHSRYPISDIRYPISNPTSYPRPDTRRILIVSNGYGEDAMGAALARELVARGATVSAYPLVGMGHSYQSVATPLLDPGSTLPTAGFGFRTGVREAWRDLRAGWIRLTIRQRAALRAAHGAFDRVVAIGDTFCLWMAAAAQPGRVVYVPTAKSELNEPHLGFEIAMIRHLADVSFPRDEVTTRRFRAAGLRAEYVGNLMMDCLQFSGEDFGLPADTPVVLLLPGSRVDAAHNFRLLLEAAGRVAVDRDDVTFLCALSPTVSAQTIATRAGAVLNGSYIRVPTTARGNRELAVKVTRNFPDAASRAAVALGMAGTANEQVAGLGKPVVAFPGPGPQFTRKFLVLQAKLLGEAVVPVEDPVEAAAAVLRLLDDPAERARRGAVGRERMGAPGAAKLLAERVLAANSG